MPNAKAIGLNGLFKAVVKLAFWAMAAEASDLSTILVEGIAAAPPEFVEGALDRMESMKTGLFWEVNERVIAFDWVEEPLRTQIPRLRAALRRAKGAAAESQQPSAPHKLVQPTQTALPALPELPAPAAAASPSPSPSPSPSGNGSATPAVPAPATSAS
jgi:hypothetical protein